MLGIYEKQGVVYVLERVDEDSSRRSGKCAVYRKALECCDFHEQVNQRFKMDEKDFYLVFRKITNDERRRRMFSIGRGDAKN